MDITRLQGGLAHLSGSSFEQQLFHMFMKSDRYSIVSKDVVSSTSNNLKQLVLKPLNNNQQHIHVKTQHKFKDCYDNDSRMDFVLDLNNGKRIFIECKYQQSAGSVSSKIPYSCALLNHLCVNDDKVVYLSGGEVFNTKRVQNIMRHMHINFPDIKFIHIDNNSDYDVLFEYINEVLTLKTDA